MQTVAVIPSRFASRRFPGKALATIAGEPLIARVAWAVLRSELCDHVIVATDDRRIAEAVEPLPVEVVLSHQPFRRGSDRVAATVAQHPVARDAEVIVNVQGDEVFLDASVIRSAIEALDGHDVGTVSAPLGSASELAHHDIVKLCAAGGRALWFGRGRPPGELGAPATHVGVYSFRREALRRFAALPSCPAEVRCDLEQLRALNAGMSIGVRAVRRRHRALNTQHDLEVVRRAIAEGRWRDGQALGGDSDAKRGQRHDVGEQRSGASPRAVA